MHDYRSHGSVQHQPDQQTISRRYAQAKLFPEDMRKHFYYKKCVHARVFSGKTVYVHGFLDPENRCTYTVFFYKNFPPYTVLSQQWPTAHPQFPPHSRVQGYAGAHPKVGINTAAGAQSIRHSPFWPSFRLRGDVPSV